MRRSELELTRLLDRHPRIRLATLPTPLQEWPRLTAALGGPRIVCKRDDLTGLGLGGNKVRKLEYLLPAVLARGATTLVTGAAVQSNWCRQATAAAVRVGLRASLILWGDPGAESQGSLLIDELLGAEISIREFGSRGELHEALNREAEALNMRGECAHVITGLEPAGLLGYVAFVLESARQCRASGVTPTHVIVSSGTGTHAGIALGSRLLGLDWSVVGVSPIAEIEGQSIAERQSEVGNALSRLLGIEETFVASELRAVLTHVPDRERLSDKVLEAIKLVARTEGILLDPIYTGSAMAWIIDEVRAGRLGRSHTLLFVHTGGTPALFAYNAQLTDRQAPLTIATLRDRGDET